MIRGTAHFLSVQYNNIVHVSRQKPAATGYGSWVMGHVGHPGSLVTH